MLKTKLAPKSFGTIVDHRVLHFVKSHDFRLFLHFQNLVTIPAR